MIQERSSASATPTGDPSHAPDPAPRGAAKRERLLREADRLFYEIGISRVSLADLAEASGVPLGNVYYHFRTRESLIEAVIARRRAAGRERLAACDREPTPRKRLEAWVRRFENEAEDRTRHGCRIGTLCQEANKLGGELAREAAEAFSDFTAWTTGCLRALGLTPARAREEAVHLLAGIQGAVLVSQTLRDPSPLLAEVGRWRKRFAEWEADANAVPKTKKKT